MNDRIKTQEVNKYTTTDLAITAYLVLFFPITNLNRIEGNRFEFAFERTSDLEERVQTFFDNTALVSPTDYFNSLKNLKSRIHAGV